MLTFIYWLVLLNCADSICDGHWRQPPRRFVSSTSSHSPAPGLSHPRQQKQRLSSGSCQLSLGCLERYKALITKVTSFEGRARVSVKLATSSAFGTKGYEIHANLPMCIRELPTSQPTLPNSAFGLPQTSLEDRLSSSKTILDAYYVTRPQFEDAHLYAWEILW